MALTFQHKGLAALLADAETSWLKGIRPLYGDHHEAGFWLVGDEGVYLMHNGEGWEPGKEIYSNESNPRTMDFDSWWNGKQENFGGDDGVDFFPASIVRDAVEKGADLSIEMTEGAMTVSAVLHKGGAQ